MIGRMLSFRLQALIERAYELRDRYSIRPIIVSLIAAGVFFLAGMLLLFALPASVREGRLSPLLPLAALFIAVGGALEVLDGESEIARPSKYERFTASALDVFGEMALYAGTIVFASRGTHSAFVAALAAGAFITTMFIHYLRISGGALAGEMPGLLSTRFERYVMLAVPLFVGFILPAMILILVINIVTIYQLLFFVHRSVASDDEPKNEDSE